MLSSHLLSFYIFHISSSPISCATPSKNWALSLPRPTKPPPKTRGWGGFAYASLLLSNLVSLLLGAGLGVWIYRRWITLVLPGRLEGKVQLLLPD